MRVGATADTPSGRRRIDPSRIDSFEITVATSNLSAGEVYPDRGDVGYAVSSRKFDSAPLGEEKIAVVVNPANTTDDLSLLRGIYDARRLGGRRRDGDDNDCI